MFFFQQRGVGCSVKAIPNKYQNSADECAERNRLANRHHLHLAGIFASPDMEAK